MLAKGKPIAYPELIRAGDWKVREWNPETHRAPCTANNEMFLPAGNKPFAREVRFHELLHVAYSPKDGCPDDAGVSKESLLAAEDCRVNVKGAMIRPHDAIGTDPNGAPDAYMVASKMSERGLARLTAAMCGYVSTDKILSKLQEDLDALCEVDKLPQWLRDHACDLERVVRAVRRHAPGYVTLATNEFQDAINLAAWLDTFADADTDSLSKGKGSEDGDGDYEQSPGYGDSSNARWGEMKIETPALSVRHRTAIGHRTSPSTEGARMVHFNRLVTGEVYGRTRKRAVPDAVLIDQSGSMHWNAKKLDELVKAMPVGIIAGYCGEGGTGVLRILAKDGRMVAPHDVKAPHGGNEVDGPALRWLARQRGRRVWVSDEGVCSDLSRDDEALAADCREVCESAGIKVCLSTDPRQIMLALRGMGGKRD